LLTIKFPDTLVLNDKAGNSLVMANAQRGDSSIDLKVKIQPQVAKDSVNLLMNTMTGIKWFGIAIPLIQFIFTRAFDARLFFFLVYAINMQNLAFLPSLGVNNPSQVGIFVKNLVQLSTFNVYPINSMWGWDFKKLGDKPSVLGFERIGITDRAILSRIGTILIFCLIIYSVWAVVSALLNYYRNVRGVSTILDWIGIKSLSTLSFLFFYVVYMQLFIGSLINWDNARFINSPSNFGANGNLDFDDQFNIIIGFIMFGLCLMFPAVVWWVMDKNYKKLMMNNKDRSYFYK
jgi:hypothetical protein